MGRWKRRDRKYRRSNSSASVSSVHSDSSLYPDETLNGGSQKSRGFNRMERERLVQYLKAYRREAETIFYRVEENDNGNSNAKGSANVPLKIGKDNFPALTPEVLREPYLMLPNTLTSKQRRIVHEYCVDVDLFHCGVGEDRNSRCVAISIHDDGFSYIDGLYRPKQSFSLRNCRPWYYRTDHPDVQHIDTPIRDNATTSFTPCAFVMDSTQRGREAIERLIDHPDICLRDDCDTIDFATLEAEDLSSVKSMSDDSWSLVDTVEKLNQCVQELNDLRPTEIGFDLEMYNRSRHFQYTCLIQLSCSAKDYVIDVLAPGVWDSVGTLAPLFADPNVVKIGHAIGGMDVASLHRDFGIFVVNAFDTYEAAKALGLKRAGLASVCKNYGLQNSDEYTILKEMYQNTNWSKRPLTEPMLRYGRTDVHYLIELRRLMIRDLTRYKLWDHDVMDHDEEARMVAKALAESLRMVQRAEGDVEMMDDTSSIGEFSNATSLSSEDDGFFTPGEADEDMEGGHAQKSVFLAKDLRMHAGLMTVITRSQQCCLRFWKEKKEVPTKNAELISVIKRAAAKEIEWTNSNMELYNKLVSWRQDQSSIEMILPGAICSLEFLVLVARKRPINEMGLRQITFFLPPMLEENPELVAEVLLMVRSSVQADGVSQISPTSRKFMRMLDQNKQNGTSRSLNKDRNLSQAKDGRSGRRLVLTVVLAALAVVSVTVVRRRR